MTSKRMSMSELAAAEAAVGGEDALALLISRTAQNDPTRSLEALRRWKLEGRVPVRACDTIRRVAFRQTHQERSRDLPPWLVPPLRYCGPLTRELMSLAWRHSRLLVVKSADGLRLGLSHYTHGVIHAAENTDRGKAELLALVRPRNRALQDETGN